MLSGSFAFVPAALAGVLGLVWLAQRIVRSGWLRLPPSATSSPQQLGLVQVLSLDGRRRLHLVRCEGRHVLILSGGTQDVVVGWLPGDGR